MTPSREDGDALCDFYATVKNASALPSWRCDDKSYPTLRPKSWLYVTIGDDYDNYPAAYGRVTDIKIENALLGGATLPPSFKNLEALQILSISDSQLSGSIPAHLSSKLSLLWLKGNALTGPIPTEIGLLTKMDCLGLQNNLLTETIPTEIGSLKKMRQIQLYNNKLSGSIPSELALCGNELQDLILFNNVLTGTIPTEIGALGGLTGSLKLGVNRLHGTLPTELGQLTSLRILDIARNNLVGPIPTEMGLLGSSLQRLTISNNLLSGTLPYTFQYLHNLMVLNIANNSLKGNIPSVLGGLSSITALSLSNNEFAGPLPSEFSRLTALRELYLRNNRFSGSLGSWIGKLTNLKLLDLYENKFSSSLPPELGNAFRLQTLSLDKNKFTSLIPTSLSRLQNLTTLTISGNLFNNNGLNFLSPRDQPGLQCIDVSQNNFTGQVNPDIFTLLKDLQTFSAGANCFSMPSLPVEICASKNLRNLLLDGMTSGDGCKQFYWGAGLRKKPFQFLGTYSKLSIASTLPACILSLPNLTTLHLSGLGLHGSIPNVVFAPRLVDLSLSHNKFSGQLPDHLQNRMPSFESVDLSFNKLLGKFRGDVCRTGCSYQYGKCAPDSSSRSDSCFVKVNIKVNRFSGRLPDTAIFWQNITLLEGNMISCDVRRGGTDLPQYDPFYNSYSCGSNFFIAIFLVWFFALSIGITVFVIRERKEEERSNEEKKRMEESGGESKEGGAGKYSLTFKAFGEMLLAFVESDWHKDNTRDLHIKFCGKQFPIHRMVSVVFASVAQVDTVKMEEHLSPSKREDRRLKQDVVGAGLDADGAGTRRPVSRRRVSAAALDPISIDACEAPVAEKEKNSYDIPIVVCKMLECMNELHALTIIALLLCLAMMITYGGAAPYTCMLKETYAWALTTSYRTGTPWAIVVFIFWTSYLVLINFLVMLQRKNRLLTFGDVGNGERKEYSTKTRGKEQNVAFGMQWNASYMPLFLATRVVLLIVINIGVVFTVNASYVFIVLKFNRRIQDAAQFSLVVFMLCWNKIVIPSLLHSKACFSAIPRLGMSHSQIDAFMDMYLNGITFDVVLLTINVVLVPIFATLGTSSTCFLGTFRPDVPVTSTYHFTYTSNGKTLPWTASTSFIPTFNYSHACSSLLITLYSPIYIGVAMWTTFALPVLRHLAMRVSEGRRQKLGLRRFFVQSLSDFVLLLTNGIVCPLAGLAIGVGIITRTVIMQYHIVSLSIEDKNFKTRGISRDPGSSADAAGEKTKMVALFWGEDLLVAGIKASIAWFSTLMSGVKAAIAGCCCPNGCCCCSTPKPAVVADPAEEIDNFVHECHTQVPENPIYMARWVLYIFPPLLLAFFEFDIVGDVSGDQGAAWAPAIMVVIPWCLIAFHELADRRIESSQKESRPQTMEEAAGGVITIMHNNPMLEGGSFDSPLYGRPSQLGRPSDIQIAHLRQSLEMQSTSQLDQGRHSLVTPCHPEKP